MGKSSDNRNRNQPNSPTKSNMLNKEKGLQGTDAQPTPSDEPYTFKQMVQRNWKSFLGRASTGVIVALILFMLSKWKGGASASHEFTMHALFIHPLFWVLPMCAFSLYVMTAKTDGEPVLRLILFPLIRFAEHLFGIALGACVVIATAEISVTDKAISVKIALIFLSIAWYFLFALLYTVAAQAIEDMGRAGRMNARIFWAYTGLFILTMVALFGEILPNDPSAKEIASYIAGLVERKLK